MIQYGPVHLFTCSSRETSTLSNCKMLEVSPNSYHFGSIKLLFCLLSTVCCRCEQQTVDAHFHRRKADVAKPQQRATGDKLLLLTPLGHL